MLLWLQGRQRCCGFRADSVENDLRQEVTEQFADADRPHSGLFVPGDEPAGHDSSVGGPGRGIICKPRSPLCDFLSEGKRLFSKPQQPIRKVIGTDSAWAGRA
jgi:hypothetical protein